MKQHPVATALAKYFDVPYDEVMALHEAGYGFGGITKAYFFAEKIGVTPQELLELAKGTGWGNVLKENGLHPGSGGKPDREWDKGHKDKDKIDEIGGDDVSDLAGPGNNDKGHKDNGNGKDKDKDHGKGHDKKK